MTKVIILGHGGYGTAMKRNLEMLIGEQEDYYYVDFNEQDDISILNEKINNTLSEIGDCDVLFCCDIASGTPFRVAATICTEHPNYCCIAGVGTSSYTDIAYSLEDSSASEVADQAIEVAKATIIRFPEA